MVWESGQVRFLSLAITTLSAQLKLNKMEKNIQRASQDHKISGNIVVVISHSLIYIQSKVALAVTIFQGEQVVARYRGRSGSI